jgi:hypothetical protein
MASDPYVREVGRLAGVDGSTVTVGVNYDSVSIGAGRGLVAQLTRTQAEEFAHLFVAACWEAGENARHMAAEVHEADGGDSMAHPRFPVAARYAYPDSGTEADARKAAEHLTLGEVYTVRRMEVGQSLTLLYFYGVADEGFNSVLFAPVSEASDA